MNPGREAGRRVATDPRIWWATAMQDLKAAKHNHDGGFQLVALSCCQSAVEKALKGYCATIGIIDPSFGSHKLKSIAQKACLYDEMSKGWQEALVELSGLHEASSYPYDEVEYRALNDKGYAKHVLAVSQMIVSWVMEKDAAYRKNEDPEGGA